MPEIVTINIDGRALSHDLIPDGLLRETTVLSRATVNQLTLIPATNYRFIAGSGVDADLEHGYVVGRDGRVDFPASCAGFLAGKGTSTLVIPGYPMVLSATADSDLVVIASIGLRAQTPRELIAVLVPGHGYLPQTAHGVFTTGFNIERDGSISFDPAAVGSYVVSNSSFPNSSKVGEDVTIRGDHFQPTGPVLQTGDGCYHTVAQTVLVPPVRTF